MLIMPTLLAAQQKIERHWNGQIARMYTLNKNGDYVGSYKEFDNRGRCLVSYNYNSKGEKSGKWIDYAYPNKPDKIITYSDNGGILLSTVKYEYDLTVTPMKQIMTYKMICDKNGEKIEEWLYEYGRGLFKYYEKTQNGKSFRAPDDLSIYLEQYNGNDTVYAWHDFERTGTKVYFAGKRLNGDWLIKYDKEGNIAYDKVAVERERLIQDSIATANKLAEELRIEEERARIEQIKQDSILKRQTDYRNLIDSIKHTDSLYTDVINKYAKGDERNLYKFLCKQIKVKKSKKSFDETLHISIAKVLNIEPYSNMIGNYTFNAVSKPNKTASIEYYPSQYNMSTDSYYKRLNGKTVESVLNANKMAYMTDYQIKNCIVPKDIKYKFEMQKLLINILEYCKENKIDIK